MDTKVPPRAIGKGLVFLALGLSFGLEVGTAAAAHPLGYSGRVTSSDGAPLGGPEDIKVRFFGSATEQDELESLPTLAQVRLVDGIFQLQLAVGGPLVAQIFGDGSRAVFIEIEAAGVECWSGAFD